jgi:hypothetical protein
MSDRRTRWNLVLDQAVPRNGDLNFALTFPWAIDGHSFDWKLYRNSRGDTPPLIVCDNGENGGITVPDLAARKVYFSIPQAKLGERDAGDYYYFLRDLPPAGKIVIVHGALQLFGPAS